MTAMSDGWLRGLLLVVMIGLSAAVNLTAGGGGWALQFDGINDFATFEGELPLPPFTIEMWVKPDAKEDGMGLPVVRFRERGAVLTRCSRFAGAPLFSMEDNGEEIKAGHAAIWDIVLDGLRPKHAVGTAFHWAYIQESSDYKVYLNGQLVASGSLDAKDVASMAPNPSAMPWTVGARMRYQNGIWFYDSHFGGAVDQLRIWSAARSQAEIQHYMFEHVQPSAPDLHRDWAFDEGKGLTANSPGCGSNCLNLGGMDADKAPAWVPSPVRSVGGPVAISGVAGGENSNFRLCASLVPPTAWTSAVAKIASAPRTGAVAGGLEVPLEQVHGPWDGTSTRLCGGASFRPRDAGEERVPFTVEVGLVGGGVLTSTSELDIRVIKNRPPIAGLALAFKTDGLTSYASLGILGDLQDSWSFGAWIQPLSMTGTILGHHTRTGENLVQLGIEPASGYAFGELCIESRGCVDFNEEYGGDDVVFPYADNDELVLETGMTAEQIRDARSQPHHLLVTVHCYTRGDVNADPPVPPRARVVMYQNGKAIGVEDEFQSCGWKGDPSTQNPDYQSAPWELGQEYDPGEPDAHLKNLAVTPSDFFYGILDDVVFWNGALDEQEAAQVAQGKLPRADSVVARMTFDLDEPDLCAERKLAQKNVTCYGLNEASGKTGPTPLFPWTSSVIGPDQRVPSPFYKVQGAPIYRTMEENSCTQVTLRAVDPDGDSVTYHSYGDPVEGASLRGNRVDFCAPPGAPRAVAVSFDVCDALGACASAAAGPGSVVFNILPAGPRVVALQYLPSPNVLRLVFDMATNTPSADDAVKLSQLLTVSGLPAGVSMLLGQWETGGRALRVLLQGAPDPKKSLGNITASISFGGMLRDAGSDSYPSEGAASPELETLVCGPGEYLPAGAVACRGCGAGAYLEESSEACLPCGMGTFSTSATAVECTRCSLGSFTNATGSSRCQECPSGFVTAGLGSTLATDCICPEGEYLPLSASACQSCPGGFLCPAGSDIANFEAWKALGRPEDHGHFPVLIDGHYASIEEPLSAYRCVRKASCPGGTPGSCSGGLIGLACARCPEGMHLVAGTCASCDSHDGLAIFLAALPILLIAVTLLHVFVNRPFTQLSRMKVTACMLCGMAVNVVQTIGVYGTLSAMWSYPLQEFFMSMRFISFDMPIQTLECSAISTSYIKTFSFKLLIYPLGVVLMVLGVCVCHSIPKTHAYSSLEAGALLNSAGLLMSAFFVSVALTSVEGLRCINNPNGKQTLLADTSIICWDGGDHNSIAALSLIAIACYPVLFLTLCFVACYWYSPLCAKYGVRFTSSCRFVASRMNPEFAIFSFGRNLRDFLIALLPICASGQYWIQVGLLLIVCLGWLVAQSYVQCWRFPVLNVFDSAVTAVQVMSLFSFALLSSAGDDSEQQRIVGWCIITFVTCTVLALLAAAGVRMVKYLRHRAKEFSVYITHDDVEAGVFARHVKMFLEACATLPPFLSIDKLESHHNASFGVQASQKVLVLLTPSVLQQPKAALEIVVAAGNQMPILLGQINGNTSLFAPGYVTKAISSFNTQDYVFFAEFCVDVELLRCVLNGLSALPQVVLPLNSPDSLPLQRRVNEILGSDGSPAQDHAIAATPGKTIFIAYALQNELQCSAAKLMELLFHNKGWQAKLCIAGDTTSLPSPKSSGAVGVVMMSKALLTDVNGIVGILAMRRAGLGVVTVLSQEVVWKSSADWLRGLNMSKIFASDDLDKLTKAVSGATAQELAKALISLYQINVRNFSPEQSQTAMQAQFTGIHARATEAMDEKGIWEFFDATDASEEDLSVHAAMTPTF